MNTSISHSEEFNGITTLFLSNGHEINFPTSKLIDYIKANELNIEQKSCGSGLTCDPNCIEWTECNEIDADEYLDLHWYSVVEKYYTNVVLKAEIKLVTI